MAAAEVSDPMTAWTCRLTTVGPKPWERSHMGSSDFKQRNRQTAIQTLQKRKCKNAMLVCLSTCSAEQQQNADSEVCCCGWTWLVRLLLGIKRDPCRSLYIQTRWASISRGPVLALHHPGPGPSFHLAFGTRGFSSGSMASEIGADTPTDID